MERSGEPEGTGSRWSGGIVGERNERAVVSEWSGGAMVERNGVGIMGVYCGLVRTSPHLHPHYYYP